MPPPKPMDGCSFGTTNDGVDTDPAQSPAMLSKKSTEAFVVGPTTDPLCTDVVGIGLSPHGSTRCCCAMVCLDRMEKRSFETATSALGPLKEGITWGNGSLLLARTFAWLVAAATAFEDV